MTRARPSSVAGLLSAGSIERVPVDVEVAKNLLRQAANHARTAAAGLEQGDSEGAFQLAYDACRKTCLALVLAHGLRPKGEAGHLMTFRAAAALTTTGAAKTLVVDAGNLRFVRHGAEYRAESVSEDDAHDAIALSEELLAALGPHVHALVPVPP